MVTPAARREMVEYLTTSRPVSQREACRVLGSWRSTVRYQSCGRPDGEILARLKELAVEWPKFGYRRLWDRLDQEGRTVNHKRVYRLYRREGLALRRKKRKRVSHARPRKLPAATRPNERWALDFVSDKLEGGRRIRVLTMIDEFTRECPALEAGTSIPGARVVRLLERMVQTRGLPEVIVTDNGPEFAGRDLDHWAYRQGVKLHFIRPGKPVENCYVESFNGKFRDECLDLHWFRDLDEAQVIIEDWRVKYNCERRHSSLGRLTPEEFARKHAGLRSPTAPSGQRAEVVSSGQD